LSPFEGKFINLRGNVYRIMAAITSQAKAIAGLGHGPNHFFQAEVGKAVEADELTDFLHGTGRGYQFSAWESQSHNGRESDGEDSSPACGLPLLRLPY
jgi:hypothetical protein